MAEEAAPSAKRQCTEERNKDWISELPNSEALTEPSSPEPREEKGAEDTSVSVSRMPHVVNRCTYYGICLGLPRTVLGYPMPPI